MIAFMLWCIFVTLMWGFHTVAKAINRLTHEIKWKDRYDHHT